MVGSGHLSSVPGGEVDTTARARWFLAGGNPSHHFIDEAVLLGLLGSQVAVALGVSGDLLDRLTGVA